MGRLQLYLGLGHVFPILFQSLEMCVSVAKTIYFIYWKTPSVDMLLKRVTLCQCQVLFHEWMSVVTVDKPYTSYIKKKSPSVWCYIEARDHEAVIDFISQIDIYVTQCVFVEHKFGIASNCCYVDLLSF